MLKETPSSLRAYFGLLALMSLLPLAGQISQGKFDVAPTLISLGFGGLYIYSAIRMYHLLAHRPNFLRGVLILNVSVYCLTSVASVLSGKGLTGLPFLVVAFAVTAYLYVNVGRLAQEAAANALVNPKQSS